MSALPATYLSPEEYLEIERRAEYKSEYSNGEMFAMAGASRSHTRISLNIAAELRDRLRSGRCEPYNSDMRVAIPFPRKYVYPNVSASCGEPEFEDSELDTLVNPVLIVEVLSPSTERYDRSTKLDWYRRVPSVKEIVFVSQTEARVIKYARRGREWVLTETDGLGETLPLESVGCELALADIYERVEFPPPPPHFNAA